jgi:hypothetical protein
MKTINSRTIVALGAVLTVTTAIGCFDGGSGYSNRPYDDGGGSYSQSYGNSNAYNTGYRDGVRTDEVHTAHDNQYDNQDRHIVVSRDHDDQVQGEKHPPSADHHDDHDKESQSVPPSQRN